MRGEFGWHFRRGTVYWFLQAQWEAQYPASVRTEPVKGKTLVVEHKKENTARLVSPVNEPVTKNKAKKFLKF